MFRLAFLTTIIIVTFGLSWANAIPCAKSVKPQLVVTELLEFELESQFLKISEKMRKKIIIALTTKISSGTLDSYTLMKLSKKYQKSLSGNYWQSLKNTFNFNFARRQLELSNEFFNALDRFIEAEQIPLLETKWSSLKASVRKNSNWISWTIFAAFNGAVLYAHPEFLAQANWIPIFIPTTLTPWTYAGTASQKAYAYFDKGVRIGISTYISTLLALSVVHPESSIRPLGELVPSSELAEALNTLGPQQIQNSAVGDLEKKTYELSLEIEKRFQEFQMKTSQTES